MEHKKIKSRLGKEDSAIDFFNDSKKKIIDDLKKSGWK